MALGAIIAGVGVAKSLFGGGKKKSSGGGGGSPASPLEVLDRAGIGLTNRNRANSAEHTKVAGIVGSEKRKRERRQT